MLKDLIAQRVRLTRRGRIHWGLCPFHPDKHPSLAVYDDDDHYHCFACEAHGDAISWLMKVEKLPYTQARKRLGREVPSPRRRNTQDLQPREDDIAWPPVGVEYAEVALLRERLVLSSWRDERVLFTLWASAPQCSNERLRLLHPYAQDLVLDRLRQIYPKSYPPDSPSSTIAAPL